MKRILSVFLVALLVISLAFMAVGCDKKADTNKDKVYKVGSETTYPPFEMVDNNGKFTGFDMELFQAIAEAGGFKIEIVSLGFDGLIPALQAGNIDAAISAMSINDERKKSVDFSDPYFNSGLIIAVPADNNTIKTLNDLKGKTVAVQIGTTGASMAESIKAKNPSTVIKTFNTIDIAFAEMKNKGADAVINDMPVTADYIKKGHPEAKMVGSLLSAEPYGIAFAKGSEFKTLVDNGLKKIKENGKYDEIFKKYFGDMPQ
ncbi:MAG: basic amino acid ABC transporter substrate-binding protein [Solirubrobacterales bacterium]